MIRPPEAGPLLAAFAPLFTQPTFGRFATRTAAGILTPGRRTVANLLRTLGTLAAGHRTSYQRVPSAARWSGVDLGCPLAAFRLRHLVPDGPVVLVGDDPVDGHTGKRVYGKARHRDPVRSTHSYTAWRYGHRWVVLAVLVKLPFARRPWALPVLVDLYRSREDNAAGRRTHRTPARLLCRLLRLMPRRFPGPGLRVRRRFGVRDARGGPVLPPPPGPADPGEQAAPGRQPVHGPAAVPGQGAAAGQGGGPAQAPGGCGPTPFPHRRRGRRRSKDSRPPLRDLVLSGLATAA